jgi:hypothetical protein
VFALRPVQKGFDICELSPPRNARRWGIGRRAARCRARFRLERLEDCCWLSDISSITEFTLPSPQSSITGITTGPDGDLWFTDRSANAIGEMNSTIHELNIAIFNSVAGFISTHGNRGRARAGEARAAPAVFHRPED